MSNVQAPMGFRLILSAGHEPVRRIRHVDSSNAVDIAPGDAVTIEADGNVTRCNGSTQPNGIVEGLVLQGVNQGPVSYDYLPALTAGDLIVFEDPTVQFETQTTTAIPAVDYDSGAEVNIVDTTPNTTLAQSRQAIGAAGGNQLRLVQPIDRVNNDKYLIYAAVAVALIPANVQ